VLLLVHHEPHGSEHLRGAIAIEGAATTILRTFKERLGSGAHQVTVETRKQKDIPEPEPFQLQVIEHHKSAVLTLLQPGQDALSQTEMFILQTLEDAPAEWVSKSELLKTCGLVDRTFYYNINKLINKGYVDQVKHGRSQMLRYIPPGERTS
jgi:hypothetical protein